MDSDRSVFGRLRSRQRDKEALRTDPFWCLDDDALFVICLFLSATELARLASVSRACEAAAIIADRATFGNIVLSP